ncbi:VanW family protein [Candidatus Dojkabacteria bacterium]|nr:VanW family protein [Candidatus Dojkabacteria bacterium]
MLAIILLNSAFIYYISAHTLLRGKILPDVLVAEDALGFDDSKEIELNFHGKNQKINIKDLNLKLTKESEEKLENYGKDPNIFITVYEGVSLIDGEDLDVEYEMDFQRFFDLLVGQSYSLPRYSDGEVVLFCNESDVVFELDENLIISKLVEALGDSDSVDLGLEDILADDSGVWHFDFCLDVEDERQTIIAKLAENLGTGSEGLVDVDEGVNYGYSWKIQDYQQLEKLLNEKKQQYDQKPFGGEDEIVGDKIFLFKEFNPGRRLDVGKSIERIENWLGAVDGDLVLAYESYDWEDEQPYEVLDFTKEIGVGKTRIDLIRNGRVNYGVFNAEVGLLEVHNVVVQPGEEFSYIDNLEIGLDGVTADGRTVGGGICNATTTLYRAAIESGLDILKSQRHTFYVKSYEWGYPLNIVDAAYFYSPRVDLILKNTYKYPIVFRIATQKKLDGYQYHYVSVRTSKLVEDRKIELTDWTRTNAESSEFAAGHFTRNMYLNGKLIKSEKFGE